MIVDGERVEIRATSKSKIQNPNLTIRNPQPAIHNPHSAIHNPQSAIHNPHSAIRIPQSAIRNPQSAELVFLKLGGSLITDKTREATARPEVIRRLAGEVAEALAARPGLRLVLGHGSGSFGHMAGERYGTRCGVSDAAGWRGFAETALAAQRLNRLVADAFWQAGVPVWSLQPSASACCRDGELVALDWRPVAEALLRGLVPLLYGDVALDEVRGGTIVSTEEIFAWLARRLKPDRLVLAGAVPGVMRSDNGQPQVIAEITPRRLAALSPLMDGAQGTDVTGGMLAKVRTMCALVEELPYLQVRLISGLEVGLLTRVLGDAGLEVGTLIRADAF
ncbi:MAG: isopentenyl phosphate kinase [Anaerolineae bacterium]|nr:isopentenyl phosphate kinase [Anaerolineae bacterium]